MKNRIVGDKKSAGYPPVILKEMLKVNYSEEASRYDTERYRERPTDVRLSGMAKVLLPKWIVGKTVLELACGTGYWGQYLENLGYDYRGIEISKGMVAECKKKGLDVAHADVEDMASHGLAPVDTLLCFKAFGFFTNPVRVLKTIRPLLNDGGRFINFYYNDRYHNAVVRLYALFRDPDEIAYQPPWDNRFTWREYKWMCKVAGLKVIYIRDCVVLPFKIVPGFLRPLAGKLDDKLTHFGFVTMVVCEK